METSKRRDYVIVDDIFLVEIIDEKTLGCVPGERWGVAFSFDPHNVVIISNVQTMGLIPLTEHEADLRALIKATV
jgi:hypothetical protein